MNTAYKPSRRHTELNCTETDITSVDIMTLLLITAASNDERLRVWSTIKNSDTNDNEVQRHSATHQLLVHNFGSYSSCHNSPTCVVLPSLCHLSASERLSYLHWLPIHYRIQFKIAALAYKTLATCQPSYLYNLLQVYHPSWALRSSTQQLLHVPYMSTDFGRCAFSYSSPATWNSIPISIKNCSSLYSFKHHLVSLYSPAHKQY